MCLSWRFFILMFLLWLFLCLWTLDLLTLWPVHIMYSWCFFPGSCYFLFLLILLFCINVIKIVCFYHKFLRITGASKPWSSHRVPAKLLHSDWRTSGLSIESKLVIWRKGTQMCHENGKGKVWTRKVGTQKKGLTFLHEFVLWLMCLFPIVLTPKLLTAQSSAFHGSGVPRTFESVRFRWMVPCSAVAPHSTLSLALLNVFRETQDQECFVTRKCSLFLQCYIQSFAAFIVFFKLAKTFWNKRSG